jgi:hypothetical protein
MAATDIYVRLVDNLIAAIDRPDGLDTTTIALDVSDIEEYVARLQSQALRGIRYPITGKAAVSMRARLVALRAALVDAAENPQRGTSPSAEQAQAAADAVARLKRKLQQYALEMSKRDPMAVPARRAPADPRNRMAGIDRAALVDPRSRIALVPADLQRMLQLYVRGTDTVPRVLKLSKTRVRSSLHPSSRGCSVTMSHDGRIYWATSDHVVMEFNAATGLGRNLFSVPDEMVAAAKYRFRGDRHLVQPVTGGLIVCTNVPMKDVLVIELFGMDGQRLAIAAALKADGVQRADEDSPNMIDSLTAVDHAGRIFVVDNFVTGGEFKLPPAGVHLHRLRIGTRQEGDDYNKLHRKSSKLPMDDVGYRCAVHFGGTRVVVRVGRGQLLLSSDYIVMVLHVSYGTRGAYAICWFPRRNPTVLRDMQFVDAIVDNIEMAVDGAGVVVFWGSLLGGYLSGPCTLAPGEEGAPTYGMPSRGRVSRMLVGGNGLVLGIDAENYCTEFISADLPDDHTNLPQPAPVALTATIPAAAPTTAAARAIFPAAPSPYEFRPARTFVQWRPEDSGTWGYPSRAVRPDN